MHEQEPESDQPKFSRSPARMNARSATLPIGIGVPLLTIAVFTLGLATVAAGASANREGRPTSPGASKSKNGQMPARAVGRAHASIVGGSPAGGSYPFMALVEEGPRGPRGGGACSGTLVASNMVLTAAHCVIDPSTDEIIGPELFEIKLGTPQTLGGGHWYGAESIYVAPGYSFFASTHDAALIELSGPVPEPTIGLGHSLVTAGTTVSMLGWGDISEDSTDSTGAEASELMIGDTVVQSASYCRTEVGWSFDQSVQLCTIDAPTYQTATCFGDSGGPAIIEQQGVPVEIGIASHSELLPGEPECSTRAPRVLTSVAAEAWWIERVIEEHPAILPRMSESEALKDVFDVLRTGTYRRHFSDHYQYAIRCQRVGASRFRCEPEWGAHGLDYFGTVTVYFAWEESVAKWFYRYRLAWVNDRCYTDPGHPALCREHVSTG